MNDLVGESFLCSAACTLSAVPMTMIKEPCFERNDSKFESKIKVVILQSVSDSVSTKLSRKDSKSLLTKTLISRSNSMNLLQHASKSEKYTPKVRNEIKTAVQMSSIDVRVWGLKAATLPNKSNIFNRW